MTTSLINSTRNWAGNPKPFFTVLLPTFNRADIVGYAIKSILFQTFQDFEILVVGDGCTDNTAKVVQSFQDNRIRWFDLPKAPHFGYANRNIALREAKGTYIAFLGHDNLYLPNHLTEIYNQISSQPEVQILFSRPCWINPQGAIFPTNYSLNNRSTYEDYVLRKGNHIPASCVIYHRQMHEPVGDWDDQLTGSGDYDLWVRILEFSGREKMIFIDKITCLHFRANWRTNDIAGPQSLMAFEHLYTQIESIPSIYNQRNIPQNTSEQAFLYHEITQNASFSDEINGQLINLYDLLLSKALEEIVSPARSIHLNLALFRIRKNYGVFHIDSINDKPVKARQVDIHTPMLKISGWAFDQINESSASEVIIKLNQKYFRVDRYGLRRVDVADHFNLPQIVYAGFVAKIDLSEFKETPIHLDVLIVGFDKRTLYLPSSEKTLQIRLIPKTA